MNVKEEQNLAEKQYFHLIQFEEGILENIQSLSSIMNQLYKKNSEKVEDIRFSQAELYFQMGDYETAIFKWQHIKKKELHGWSLKNIGDAYQQLGDLEKAESFYLSIEHPTMLLKKEYLLSLYNLYKQNNLTEQAHKTIHELVKTDWTYKDVYQLAISFYEEIGDYLSAFTLIVTKLESSYEEKLLQKLQFYIEISKEEKIPPSFISTRLIKLLWKEDPTNLLQMFQVMHDYYKKSDYHVVWMDNIFTAINDTDPRLGEYLLAEKPESFFEAIEELFSGNYELKGIQHIIEYQLRDYFYLCNFMPLKRAIGSLLIAWKQHFPDSFSINDIKDHINSDADKMYRLTDIRLFYENIVRWMSSIDIDVDDLHSWWAEYYLDNQTKKLMISGSFSNGKSSFINSIVGTAILNADHLPTTSAVTILDNAEKSQILELNQHSVREIQMEQLRNKTTINHDQEGLLSKDLISIRTKVEALSENRITLIDTPGFNDQQNDHNPTYEYLDLADELLFIFSAETPFKKTEKEAIQKIMEKKTNINISFILNKIDYLDDEELEETVEDLQRKLAKTFHKEMPLIPYSSSDDSMNNLEELQRFFHKTEHLNIEEERIKKVLPYLQQLLNKFDYHVQEKEKNLNNSVRLKKKEMEEVKIIEERFKEYKNKLFSKVIQKYLQYKTSIYNHVKTQTYNNLLSYSYKLDHYGNLNQVHHILDREINEDLKIQLKKTVVPETNQIFLHWLTTLRDEINTIEEDVDRMIVELEDILNSTDSLKQKLPLANFWDEIIYSFQQHMGKAEYVQIDTFKKVNPMRTILNGVGKLLGSKHQATSLKLEQYRKHLEAKLFYDVTDDFVYQITQNLEGFEKIIQSAFNKLLSETEDYIKGKRTESAKQMIDHAQTLKGLYEAKESYLETLDIFKIKLGQLEIDFSVFKDEQRDAQHIEIV